MSLLGGIEFGTRTRGNNYAMEASINLFLSCMNVDIFLYMHNIAQMGN